MIMETLYTAEALSTGAGRNGHVRSTDGRIDVDLAPPKEMGGSGAGANPEQLFAAGYAACFHSALQSIARAKKIAVHDSSVGALVHIGPDGQGGFGLAVELEIVLPDLDPAVAQELAEAAHQVCPYSNATRGNIDVTLTVVED
jgi:osmotically inducible protein OsmC